MKQLTMEAEPEIDEDTLEFFLRVFVDEETMQHFREHLEHEKYDRADVARFGKAEQIWFHCRLIPMVKERCGIWKFQLQFRAQSRKIWGFIHTIRGMLTMLFSFHWVS